MKRYAILPALLLSVSATLGATLLDPTTGRRVELEPGDRLLHLVFFATWCPTCVEELTDLAELEARWARQGYRLVIVATQTRQTADRLADFVAERKPPGRLLFDDRGEAARTWGAERLPTHVLLDRTGKEIARSGELDERIRTTIAERLSGREPPR